MNTNYLFIFYFLLCNLLASAQDLHFSQLYNNPHNLNAAEIGFFDGTIRANGIVRNQWKSIPVPYQTNCLAIDFSQVKKIKKFNLGFLVNNDNSGDSKYTQNSFLLGVSKLIKLNSDSSLLFGIGIQNGIFANSFQTQKLSFDEQYNGVLYDPTSPSGENFSTTKTLNFNSNLGAIFAYRYSSINSLIFGISIQQLVNSKLSFFNNHNVQSNPKLISYFRATHNFTGKKFMLPYMSFIKREKNHEFTIGTAIGQSLSNPNALIKPYIGLFFRNKDAYFVQLGTFYNQFNFAFSYDVNFSKLKVATNNRGAFEFILIYIFKKSSPFLVPQKNCPVFL